MQNLQVYPDIRIVGPRSSGKTAFIAALACWHNTDPNSPILSVTPYDDQANTLRRIARDVLKQGLQPASTPHVDDPTQLPQYTLLIQMKPAFSEQPIKFKVSCREYSGELVEDLLGGSIFQVNLKSYLDDCASVRGLLLSMDGTSRQDDKYAKAFETLKIELGWRLVARENPLSNYRIAVAFTKCEQEEVWIHRYNLERFLNVRFSSTRDALADWCREWNCKINYYLCSAFGTTDGSKPNAIVENKSPQGTTAVLAKPNLWKPIGLVAPIYWLHTGQDDPRLNTI
ncbi:MAG: hypothetical protein AB4426_23425 [Xenococcaceae cyanobacterium]